MTRTKVFQGKASEMQPGDEVHVLGRFVKVTNVWNQGNDTHFEIDAKGSELHLHTLHCSSEFEMLFKRPR